MLRRRHPSLALPTLLLAALALAAAATVQAQVSSTVQVLPRQPVGVVVGAGDDAWITSPKGSTTLDFSQDPLPGGFFCAGSPPFGGTITIDGTPLATNPLGALGNADTLVRRLDDTAALPVGGSDTVAIEILALALDAVQSFAVNCDDGTNQWTEWWTLSAGLSPSVPQANGTMTIHRTHSDGGTYDSVLPVKLLLNWNRVSPSPGTITQDCGLGQCEEMVFSATGASWTEIGGQGGYDPNLHGVDDLPAGVQVDIDHDGIPDGVATIGRSNFQVGVTFVGAGGGSGGSGGEGDCDGTAHINGQSKIETHTTFLSQDSDADGQPNDCDPCPDDPEDQCEPQCEPTQDGTVTADATAEPSEACPRPTEL